MWKGLFLCRQEKWDPSLLIGSNIQSSFRKRRERSFSGKHWAGFWGCILLNPALWKIVLTGNWEDYCCLVTRGTSNIQSSKGERLRSYLFYMQGFRPFLSPDSVRTGGDTAQDELESPSFLLSDSAGLARFIPEDGLLFDLVFSLGKSRGVKCFFPQNMFPFFFKKKSNWVIFNLGIRLSEVRGWVTVNQGKTSSLSEHFNLICINNKMISPQLYVVWMSEWVKVAQLCPTLWDPMDYTVHGILQARILEWAAVAFSRGSSQPTDGTQFSRIAGRFFTSWDTRIAHVVWILGIRTEDSGPTFGMKPEAGTLFTASLLQKPFQFSLKPWGCVGHNSRTSVKRCQVSQVALVLKNPPANAGDIRDVSSIPGSGRSPGGGQGNLLQYSCLENSVDRGAWRATVRRVTQSQAQLKRCSMHTLGHLNKVMYFS